ncbi:MAG: hypothetical protein KDK12_02690 [Rhodobacteraceae bacterium]|nr:hypothetical protein [Paracoccaceae bacterium]
MIEGTYFELAIVVGRRDAEGAEHRLACCRDALERIAGQGVVVPGFATEPCIVNAVQEEGPGARDWLYLSFEDHGGPARLSALAERLAAIAAQVFGVAPFEGALIGAEILGILPPGWDDGAPEPVESQILLVPGRGGALRRLG